MAVIADLCNECGNCVTFCPTSGRPWRDKPRIHLDRSEFESRTDNAFRLLTLQGRRAIQGRFGGETKQLVRGDDPGNDADLQILAVLLRGLDRSMPHLPLAEPEL